MHNRVSLSSKSPLWFALGLFPLLVGGACGGSPHESQSSKTTSSGGSSGSAGTAGGSGGSESAGDTATAGDSSTTGDTASAGGNGTATAGGNSTATGGGSATAGSTGANDSTGGTSGSGTTGTAGGSSGGTTGASSTGSSSGGVVADDGGITVTACGTDAVAQSFNAGLTYYSQTAANNCQIPWPSAGSPQSGATMYTAISTNLYDDPSGSGSCGKCVQVNGKTLLVVDQCPNNSMNPLCAANHLDLGGQSTYQAVEGGTSGMVSNSPGVGVKFVACPVTGNLQYSFTSSTQQYYLAMVVLNARYGIKSVAYRAKGGSAWTQMGARTDADPNWITPSGTVPNPIDFQVTDEWGQVVEDTNITWVAGQVVTGHYQFPACP